jgi:hypothetical protein
MVLNRFWSSVGSVAAFLFGVGLLQYVVVTLVTVFGVITGSAAQLLAAVGAAVVPIVGTLQYMDWRWNWKPGRIGVSPKASSVLWLGLGAIAGAAVALASGAITALAGDAPLALPTFKLVNPVALVLPAVMLFAAEMVFRAAVISRYQADLTPREVLLAAPLTPVAWVMLNALFPLGGPPTGMLFGVADLPMLVALSLLYLRTDSVWLSAGLRIGVFLVYAATVTAGPGIGHTALWTVAAVVLFALEWFKQERAPRRMAPKPNRGRTVRGPWGPH